MRSRARNSASRLRRFRACLPSKNPAKWRSPPTLSTYFMGLRSGSSSGNGGIGGGSMNRCATPISGWNSTSWPHGTRQPGYGPGATPATKTIPGATGWHRMRQPLSEVLGRTEGHTPPFASAWVWIMCRQNPKPASSTTWNLAVRMTRTIRKRLTRPADITESQPAPPNRLSTLRACLDFQSPPAGATIRSNPRGSSFSNPGAS